MKTPAATFEARQHVGIWIRVSTEDQAQGESPKHHEMRARAYAESKGWIVREVYDLSGVSGKTVAERPETKRMMEDVRQGRIRALVFSKLARFARNTSELLAFADFFQEHNAALVSLAEAIDTSTPAGRLFYTIIAAMAQWEREEIVDRIRASLPVRAKSGKPLTGKAIFGYHYHDGKIRPHPEEGPVRKLIFELFWEHRRKKTVARLLNERGYRTRAGKLFSDVSVDYLLRDTTAKGEYRSNFTTNPRFNQPWVLKPESQWVIHPVEPVVDLGLWQRCNDFLDQRKINRGKRPGPKPVHPFAGFVHCHCGEKMYVPSNTPKYICHKCRNKIPVIDLDALFRDQLKDYLMSEEKMAEFKKRTEQWVTEEAKLLESQRAEHRRLKDEIEKVYQLHFDGRLDGGQFSRKYGPLEARRIQLEEEVANLEAAVASAKVESQNTEFVMSEAKTNYAAWPKMTLDQKRRVIENLVDTIIVREGELDIKLCYAPPSKEIATRQHSQASALT